MPLPGAQKAEAQATLEQPRARRRIDWNATNQALWASPIPKVVPALAAYNEGHDGRPARDAERTESMQYVQSISQMPVRVYESYWLRLTATQKFRRITQDGADKCGYGW